LPTNLFHNHFNPQAAFSAVAALLGSTASKTFAQGLASTGSANCLSTVVAYTLSSHKISFICFSFLALCFLLSKIAASGVFNGLVAHIYSTVLAGCISASCLFFNALSILPIRSSLF
jgi:hypothetical protein